MPAANGRLVTIVRETPGSNYVYVKHYHSDKYWWLRADNLRSYCQEWQYKFMEEYPSYGFEEVMRVSNNVFKTITRPGGLKPMDMSLSSPIFRHILDRQREAEGRLLPGQVQYIGGPKHGDVENHDNRPFLSCYLTHMPRRWPTFSMDFGCLPDYDVTASILTYDRMVDGRAILQQIRQLYPADIKAGYHYKG